MELSITTTKGEHVFRDFDNLSAALGAQSTDYPPYTTVMDDVPKKGADVCNSLFFSGGNLEQFGLKLKPDVQAPVFYTALRALMSSFDPKHELKIATCARLIDKYTEEI